MIGCMAEVGGQDATFVRCKFACAITGLRESVRIRSCKWELQEPESFAVLVVTHLLQDAGMWSCLPNNPRSMCGSLHCASLLQSALHVLSTLCSPLMSLYRSDLAAPGNSLHFILIKALLPDGWMDGGCTVYGVPVHLTPFQATWHQPCAPLHRVNLVQVQRKQVGLPTLHAKLSEYIDKIDTDLVSTQHVGIECIGMEDVRSLWGTTHVGRRPTGCSG